MIAPQLNSAIRAHLISQSFSPIEMMPLMGYEDTAPPFIIYNEFDIPVSHNNPFKQESTVIYYIYDRSVSVLMDIEYHIKRFLTPEFNANAINAAVTMPGGKYRILSCTPSGGGLHPALEREGFFSKSLMFDVSYIYFTQTE